MIARSAAEAVLGEACQDPRLLAAGRSSTAWTIESTSGRWVVRVPIPDSGRTLSYRSEARIGHLLGEVGHPVASWTVVELGDTLCSVGPLMPGSPVDCDTAFSAGFSAEFAAVLGRLLADTHALQAVGFGPLIDDGTRLKGRSGSIETGITDRWCHARIWPFDEGGLWDHPIAEIAPETIEVVTRFQAPIVAAATKHLGVTHSDLHQQHLLQDDAGRLSAVLDFGDSFIGSAAWDFALLHWYYGASNADSVAVNHPLGAEISDAGRHLAIAVGLYKLAKNPSDATVAKRLQRTLAAVTK